MTSSPVPEIRGLPRVRAEALASLPTTRGPFRIHVFSSERDSFEHVALVRGDIAGASGVLTSIHSECLPGSVFASLRCDCGARLAREMARLEEAPCGVLLYLRQARSTLESCRDAHDYAVAAAVLRDLGVLSVSLSTSNPEESRQLALLGMPGASHDE